MSIAVGFFGIMHYKHIKSLFKIFKSTALNNGHSCFFELKFLTRLYKFSKKHKKSEKEYKKSFLL